MTSSENKYNIWIYCILIITAFLYAFYVVSNIKISPDGMRFGLISEQILSGNGIKVPLIRLEDNYIPVNGAIPFLDQLPLVPILFALMGGLTPETYLPAQLLNMISHMAIAIFTFLLMQKLYDKKSIALLTGILVSLAYPLLKAAHLISSEPLFIAFTLASVYFLILSRDPRDKQFRRNFVVAGLCASASIMTRNAGIAIIPVFFWEAIILVKNKRPESKHLSTILAISLPVITAMTIFIRNYMISGSLRGFEQASPERSLPEAFAGTIKMMFEQFHLGGNAIVLIALFVLLFVFSIVVSINLRAMLLKLIPAGLDLAVIFILSYTALVCLTMATQQWNYELRFVYPLVPFFIVISMIMIVSLWDTVKLTGFNKLSFSGMILSLSILTVGVCYKTFVNRHDFLYEQERAYSILNSCAFEWIRNNYDEKTIIATNRPFHLGFFGGYPTIALPHKRFNPTINVPEDMGTVLPERMSKFGATVLVLFEKADERYEGKYIATLFNKRGANDNFPLAYECPDGVVYTLKE